MSGSLLEKIGIEIAHLFRSHWSLQDIGVHWDQVEDYDEVNKRTYSYFRRFEDAFRLSDIPDHSRVLDLCTRTGKGTLFFHKKGKIDSVCCADVSEKMLSICRKRLEEGGVKKFSCIKIIDYSLPFPPREFDSVLCFETMEHFSEPERMFLEFGRVIKSGGIMIVTTPNILWEPIHSLAAITNLHHSEGPHRFIRYGKLFRMIKRSGFVVETTETTVLVPGGPRVLVKAGEKAERFFQYSFLGRFFMRCAGLRRVLICRKV